MKLAAIDIGSHSMKIVVVEAAANGSFNVLASERKIVRLGQETLVNKHISREATQRAIDCLRSFRSLADSHGAEQIFAIATAFLREAANSSEFIRVVEEETGIRVEVVSGLEEARLVGLAASFGCAEKGVATLNIDIGGGSTEISIFRAGEPLKLVSIDLGAVRLTDRLIRSDPPAASELDAMRSDIRASLQPHMEEFLAHGWSSTTATSGTATTIGAAINHVGPRDSSTVTLDQLKQLNKKLAAMTIAERRAVPGIPPQRADVIVSGGMILEEVMTALGIKSLLTCDWCLREGAIIDRLRHSERSSRN